jgi:tRNA-dihydrouridine synthase B
MLPWFQNNQFPLYLAPMAGFTDTVYRQLCKREGADVMVSEFVMSDSVNLEQDCVWETVDFTEDQRPMGIQIFGSSAASITEAARRIQTRVNPDFIDLNFGCPSEKVTCQDAGASLLKDPRKLVAIAAAVVKALPDLHITAKIRLGWDDQNIVAHELAPRLQDAGIQALTIHGRTKVQGYTGEANWDIIQQIADQVDMPIIGNGNIRNSAQVHQIKTNSNVKGVMIGRAALGYPWLFNEIKTHLATGKAPLPPTLKQRWSTIIDYAQLLTSRPMRQNEHNHIMWMRPRLSKLTKDMLGCKQLRYELNKVEHIEDLHPIAEKHIARYAYIEKCIFERLTA